MIDRKSLSKTKLDALPVVEVKNPLSREQEIMRPSLLPGLLTTIQLNLNRGQKDLRLFEIGKEYLSTGEKEVAALAMTGAFSCDWRRPREEANFFDIKGVVENLVLRQILNYRFKNQNLLSTNGEPTNKLKFAEPLVSKEIVFVPKEYPAFKFPQSAEVLLNGRPVGILGLVNAGVLNQWDIKHKNIYYAQLDVSLILNSFSTTKEYQPIAGYPGVVRDISLAVKQDISFDEVRNVILRNGTEFLTSVKFLEQYLGEKIPEGFRGLVFSLTFQAADKTLREEEVSSVYDRICQALVSQLGAIRR